MCVELELVDGEGEGGVSVFLGAIEPSADLRAVQLIVARPSRDLDLCDVSVLCGICGPLHRNPRSGDTWDDTMHQLKFGDLEVSHWFVPLPHTSAGIQDGLFVGVKELE